MSNTSFIDSLPEKSLDRENKVSVTIKISQEEDHLLSMIISKKQGYTKDEIIYLLLKKYIFDDPSLKNESVYTEPKYKNCYIVNTNKKHSDLDDPFMINNGYAATFDDPHYLNKMYKIKKGDLVFLYRSGTGIVAHGIASGNVKSIVHDGKDTNYQELSEFKVLDKPLTPSDIHLKLGRNVSFLHTLFSIDDGEKLLA